MITFSQFLEMEARCDAGRKSPVPDDACDRESGLQDDIHEECLRRGWCPIWTRRDKKTTFKVPGVCDFIIVREGPTIFVETKTRTGKLTTDQLAFRAWLKKLGHTVHEIRSMGEFYEILNEKRP